MAGILDGKVALITGAGSGIGQATSRIFAREGAKVCVADVNAKGAEETARSLGGIAVAMDVTKEDQVDAGVAALLDRLMRGSEQKFFPTADESRVEGVFGEGQVDDRLRGLDDGAPLLMLDEVVVEHGELAPVNLQRISVSRKGKHQPLGTGALDVPRLNTRRESAKVQRLPTGSPLDRRTRDLNVGDGPFLLRFAPQRKGDRASTEHLILPFSSEDVLELDVTQTCLRFGDEIVDRHIAVTAAVDHNLPGSLIGVLRFGNR